MLGHIDPGLFGIAAIENTHRNCEISRGLRAVSDLPNLCRSCCRRASVLRENPLEGLGRSGQSRVGYKKDIDIFAIDDYRSRDKRY